MVTIEYPGWQTIARHWRPEPDTPIPPTPPTKSFDPHDPATWSCRFNVFGNQKPPPDHDWKPPPKKPLPSHIKLSLQDNGVDGRVIRPQKDDRPPERPTAIMARRIEALQRILANPAPAIARLARFLAHLPRGALAAPDPWKAWSRAWRHGRQDYFDAVEQAAKAYAIWDRLIEPG